MAQQTALNTLIAELKKRKESYANIPALDATSQLVKDQCLRSLDESMAVAHSLLPMERQQIEGAFDEEFNGAHALRDKYIDGSDYFKNTYEK